MIFETYATREQQQLAVDLGYEDGVEALLRIWLGHRDPGTYSWSLLEQVGYFPTMLCDCRPRDYDDEERCEFCGGWRARP